jgi:hypothetical protein
MLRFLVGLMIVLGMFCLVWTFLGENAFFWALLVGFVTGGVGLIYLPLARRGAEYAYQKWYLRNSIWVVLATVAIVVGGIFFIARVVPETEDFQTRAAAVGLVVVLVGFAYLFSVLLTPTTRRRSWLRRRYPAVAAAIKRYEKRGDVREYYNPALVIDDKPYFLILYYANEAPPRRSGVLLLDEMGVRVADEDLVERAVRCKSLALETIDYRMHQKRLQTITGGRMAVTGLRRTFGTLRERRGEFSRQGGQNVADLDEVFGAEEPMIKVIEAGIAMKQLEAEWAAKHGLGRLTEVRYEDMTALQSAMQETRRPAVAGLERITSVVEAAKRLAEVAKTMYGLPNRKEVEEGLLGVADTGEALKGETEAYEYARFTERDWQAWRERMAWADEVDGKMAESAA